ncbi:YdbL family protein [Planctobacterium marinum]|uniref:DUF1318 domain-containing protein n=1 Tax=Planctobacterium marinum TaxID=1631968 RepID=A0AA48HMW6_9ALTE|nr:hypothetical protein MACH26_36750 [Planctobacterium marinum]
MKHFLKPLLLLCLLAFNTAAFAISLDKAKAQGLVGEQLDGYLGLVVQNSEALKLIEDVNGKRKALYQKLAEKNGVSLEVVAKLAAEKAAEKTQSGHFIQNMEGEWVKKP